MVKYSLIVLCPSHYVNIEICRNDPLWPCLDILEKSKLAFSQVILKQITFRKRKRFSKHSSHLWNRNYQGLACSHFYQHPANLPLAQEGSSLKIKFLLDTQISGSLSRFHPQSNLRLGWRFAPGFSQLFAGSSPVLTPQAVSRAAGTQVLVPSLPLRGPHVTSKLLVPVIFPDLVCILLSQLSTSSHCFPSSVVVT